MCALLVRPSRFLQLLQALSLGVAILATASTAATAKEADQDQVSAFAPFLGEWTLEDDTFHQVWDGKTLETLTIPRHFTRCAPINTRRSVLCVVSSDDLHGHILWVADEEGRLVSHLSHFGDRRAGVGTGTFDDQSNITLRIEFSDEPEGSYRVYRYRWLDADRYEMRSVQYDASGSPTGNWYGGTFVRLAQDGASEEQASAREILRILDDQSIDPAEKLRYFAADAMIMQPGTHPIMGHDELLQHLVSATLPDGVEIEHRVREISRAGDLVSATGGVCGEVRLSSSDEASRFATNNLILFKRIQSGDLRIWRVIYNEAPSAGDGSLCNDYRAPDHDK